VSFFVYTTSRLGNQDSVLLLASTVSLYYLNEALATQKTRHYICACLAAAAAPLVKTSAAYVPLAVGAVLLYKFLFDRTSVRWRGVAAGISASILCLAAATAIWFWPHRDYLAFIWCAEIVSRGSHNISFLPATLNLVGMLLSTLPIITLFGTSAFVLRLGRALSSPRSLSNLDLTMMCWLAAACVPLIYSGTQYPRWLMWLMTPLGVLALDHWTETWAPKSGRSRTIQWAVFLCACLLFNYPMYRRYFANQSFYWKSLIPKMEELAGTNVVSGEIFQNLTYSRKLNIVSDYLHNASGSPATCEAINAAFDPGKQPKYIGVHVGLDPASLDESLRTWYAACPEWKSQYQPCMLVRRIDYRGEVVAIVCRTNQPFAEFVPVISPQFNPPHAYQIEPR
jgi:hypothetical protein